MPFRIRVSMSAMGSVIDILRLLPTGLCHAGDVSAERELPETNPAEFEFAQEAARTPANLAAILRAGHELRLPLRLDDHCRSCHRFVLRSPFAVGRPARLIGERPSANGQPHRAPKGIPSSLSKNRACSSFFAVVTMVMFMPFDLST